MAEYAHRKPYVTQRQITPSIIPYLGGPADRMAAAFTDGYQAVTDLMRTPLFASNIEFLVADSPEKVVPYIEAQLEHAGKRMQPITVTELNRLLIVGAATARQQAMAQIPLQKAVGDEARQLEQAARRRRRLPPALFPGLKIPRFPSSIRIPRAPRYPGFGGQVPLDYLNAAQALALDLIKRINETQRDMIRLYIEESIRRGIDADTTAMRVANVVGLFPRWARAVSNYHRGMLAQDIHPRIAQKRADDYADNLRQKRGAMIARTELIRAMSTGRQNQMVDMASDGYIDPDKTIKTWSAAPGCCEVCAALGNPNGDWHGVRVEGIHTPFQSAIGPIDISPLHPSCRCLAGPVRVKGSSLVAMTRRLIQHGELVNVVTASGKQLSATPEHPVLTDHGWIPIGSLCEGDNLLETRFGQSAFGSDPDIDNGPMVQELFDTLWLSAAGTQWAVRAPMKFDSDTPAAHVDVVRVPHGLTFKNEPSLSQLLGKFLFSDAHTEMSLASNNTSLHGVGHAEQSCFMSVSALHASGLESMANNTSGCLEMGCYSQHAPSRLVKSNNFWDFDGMVPHSGGRTFLGTDGIRTHQASCLEFGAQAFPPTVGCPRGLGSVHPTQVQFDGVSQMLYRPLLLRVGAGRSHQISSTQLLTQSSRSGMSLLASLYDGQSFDIQFDPVFQTSRRAFSGHVYDLQTDSRWLTGNGLIVHNCSVTYRPHFIAEPHPHVSQDLRDQAALSDPEIQPALQAARLT